MRHENPTSCGPIESVYLQCETLSVYIKCLCVKIPWNAVQNRSTEAAARSIFIRFAIGPVCQAQYTSDIHMLNILISCFHSVQP